MNFKGVVFDLDGTLINSLADLADSMNKVLSNFDFPIHDLGVYNYFVGNGIRNLVRAALPESNRDEQTVGDCYKLMVEAYGDNCINKSRPYDGITDLLNELKSRKMKLGVLSNKAHDLTMKIVQALLPDYFDVIKGLVIEAHKKPDPSGALEISDNLAIRLENLIFIGDSNIDMQTARNTGMYGVGVLWGFRTRAELIESGAKYILDHPMDLLDLL